MSADDDSDFRETLLEALEANGTIRNIKAQLRASVFLALETKKDLKNKAPLLNTEAQTFTQSEDGIICASLVKNFLDHFNLKASESVFKPEIGTDDFKSRDQLVDSLKLSNCDANEPVLLALVRNSQNKSSQRESKPSFILGEPVFGKSMSTKKIDDFSAGLLDEISPVLLPADNSSRFPGAGSSSDDDFFTSPGPVALTKNPLSLNPLMSPDDPEGGSKQVDPPKSPIRVEKPDTKTKDLTGSSSPAMDTGLSGTGKSLLGALPGLGVGAAPPGGKKSALPPLGGLQPLGGVGSGAANASKSILKLLDNSLDDGEDRDSSTASDLTPKQPVSSLFGGKMSSPPGKDNTAVPKPVENKETPLDKSLDRQAQAPLEYQSSVDDISEDIAEEIEGADDLLKSDSDQHDFSF